MPPGSETTDPNIAATARADQEASQLRTRPTPSIENVAADLGRLRGSLNAHATKVYVRWSDDDAFAVQVQAELDSLSQRMRALESALHRTERDAPAPTQVPAPAPAPLPPVETPAEQDRRLFILRVVLIMLPTFAALVTPWLAARNVTLDPTAVQAVEDAVKDEITVVAPPPVVIAPATVAAPEPAASPDEPPK